MRPEQIVIHADGASDESPMERSCAAWARAGFAGVELPVERIGSISRRRLGPLRCAGASGIIIRCFGDCDMLAHSQQDIVTTAARVNQLGGGVLVAGTDACDTASSFIALDVIGRTLAELVEKVPTTVSLALHIDAASAVQSLAEAKIACDAANHPRVGICLDVPRRGSGPGAVDDLTPDVLARILHVRLRDLPDKPPDATIDLLRTLEGCGYRGFVSLAMPAERAASAVAALLSELPASGHNS